MYHHAYQKWSFSIKAFKSFLPERTDRKSDKHTDCMKTLPSHIYIRAAIMFPIEKLIDCYGFISVRVPTASTWAPYTSVWAHLGAMTTLDYELSVNFDDL